MHTRTRAAVEAGRGRREFHAYDYSSNTTTDDEKTPPGEVPTLITDLPQSQEAIRPSLLDEPLIDLSEHPY